MAVFLINICKFNGCGITFPSLGDLIQHIEDTHIDYDPKVVQQKEQAQPACLPLSYVLRFISEDARKENSFLAGSAGGGGVEFKRKLAIKHHSYSLSSSNRSNTPTGSEMDEDEMVMSESEDSNDSWTTEEFSSEFIMRYGSRHSGSGGNGTPGNEKPFACPVPGCKKRYKNVNGIKYHSKNGHKKDGKVRKGYKCHCGKSYKTAQGLKSHALASHNSSGESGGTVGAQVTQVNTATGGGILMQRSSSPSQSLGSLSPSSISNMSSSASSCHNGSNSGGTNLLHHLTSGGPNNHSNNNNNHNHSNHNNNNNNSSSSNGGSLASSGGGGGGVSVTGIHQATQPQPPPPQQQLQQQQQHPQYNLTASSNGNHQHQQQQPPPPPAAATTDSPSHSPSSHSSAHSCCPLRGRKSASPPPPPPTTALGRVPPASLPTTATPTVAPNPYAYPGRTISPTFIEHKYSANLFKEKFLANLRSNPNNNNNNNSHTYNNNNNTCNNHNNASKTSQKSSIDGSGAVASEMGVTGAATGVGGLLCSSMQQQFDVSLQSSLCQKTIK